MGGAAAAGFDNPRDEGGPWGWLLNIRA